jgi:hypothetical protein
MNAGGATGDATFLLRAMLSAGFAPGEAAFGFIGQNFFHDRLSSVVIIIIHFASVRTLS